MMRGVGGRPILGFVFGCMAGSAGAEDLTRYTCKIGINGLNRAHFSETMVISVSEAGWRVLVDDALTEKAAGRPVKAEVEENRRDRISFAWSLYLKKPRMGGKIKTDFRMTIFPQRGEATISTVWDTWGDQVTPARGTCTVEKG